MHCGKLYDKEVVQLERAKLGPVVFQMVENAHPALFHQVQSTTELMYYANQHISLLNFS